MAFLLVQIMILMIHHLQECPHATDCDNKRNYVESFFPCYWAILCPRVYTKSVFGSAVFEHDSIVYLRFPK